MRPNKKLGRESQVCQLSVRLHQSPSKGCAEEAAGALPNSPGSFQKRQGCSVRCKAGMVDLATSSKSMCARVSESWHMPGLHGITSGSLDRTFTSLHFKSSIMASLGTADSAETTASSNNTHDSSKRDVVVDKMRSAADTVKHKLHLESIRESRPVKFLSPTNIRVRVRHRNSHDSQDINPDIAFLWRSRDNRKGRRSIAVPRAYSTQPSTYFPDGPPQLSSSKAEVWK
jgi:hypothetical protein